VRLLPFLLLLPLVAGCQDGTPEAIGGTLAAPGPVPPRGPGAHVPAPDPSSTPLPSDYVATVVHPYMPLTPGTLLVYEGFDEGEPRRDEVRVRPEPETILGVACTAVVQQVFLDGEPAETTTEWYAQDSAGNVWKFGEDSAEIDGGVAVPAPDSWKAGVGGALPWMALAAEPRVGDVYGGTWPGGQEVDSVLSADAAAVVPFGAFGGCLVALATNPDDPEDADRIIYAPGVGLISEESTSSLIELVEMRAE
jgi:hypothetical protein